GAVWRFVLNAAFWPLFAPSLLARRSATGAAAAAAPTPYDGRIRAAEEQLLAALAKVRGGIAEEALAPEVARLHALRGSLASMGRRLAEIDEVLASAEFDKGRMDATLRDLAARGESDADSRVASVRVRLRNVERLRVMRARTADDLERALLKIEEMTSQ